MLRAPSLVFNTVFKIYAIRSDSDVADYSLSKCVKMYSISDVPLTILIGPGESSSDDCPQLLHYLVVGNAKRMANIVDGRSRIILQNHTECFPIPVLQHQKKKGVSKYVVVVGVVGGYWTVYKGMLSDIHVAVKLLDNITGDGEEFINEVGTMGKVHHVNVVRLIGYCADGFRRALVYEFLENGSFAPRIRVLSQWLVLEGRAIGFGGMSGMFCASSI